VWSYNHEAAYVEGVLAFADALHAVLRGDAGFSPEPNDAGNASHDREGVSDAGSAKAESPYRR
jgi:hypothetical protein